VSAALEPAAAAERMQHDAEGFIDSMHRRIEPSPLVPVLATVVGLGLLALLVRQLPTFLAFLADLRRNPTAYAFALPAVAVIFAVIVFPFFWNLVLSLSDMSLVRFRDWRVVGLQNYAEVLSDPKLWGLSGVFLKTVLWTVINVTLHVALGVMLAVALNGPIRGKAIYRLLLVIPWAVPAYITALTWRGMFDYEYGAVNLMLGKWLGLPAVNWLGEPLRAFEACIIANVWLGFPFMMVIALGGLQGIPQELYEAARIDRASRWQQFWHITLPLLKPVLLPAATLGAIEDAAARVPEGLDVGWQPAAPEVVAMLDVLGCNPLADTWTKVAADDRAHAALESLVAEQLAARMDARAQKDWTSADAIRDRLALAGVEIEDTADGARWSLAERSEA
jgi:arabinogalactan oligomer/maltooligosaccharide transport system permease protein